MILLFTVLLFTYFMDKGKDREGERLRRKERKERGKKGKRGEEGKRKNGQKR